MAKQQELFTNLSVSICHLLIVELKLTEIASGILVASLPVYAEISRHSFQTQENIFEATIIIVTYKVEISKFMFFVDDLSQSGRIFVSLQQFRTGCRDTRVSYISFTIIARERLAG